MTDAALLAAMAAGDEQALEQLYARHRDTVAVWARRWGARAEEVPAVVQEVFLYLVRARSRLQLRGRMTTLLHPVVQHAVITIVRQRRTTAPEAVAGNLLAPEPPPGEEADLTAVLADLPAGQRAVLLLRFVDDLDLQAIATRLDLPLGTVKSRLHHAVRRLRADPRVRTTWMGERT